MLLQVLLMMKDCSNVVEATLKSFIGFADKYVIVDTGSTDNSIEKIKNLNLPNVEIYNIPFIGFDKTRNQCIAIAGKEAKYTIFIDDSYVLTNPEQLIEELKKAEFDLASVNINTDSQIYKSPRIYRSSKPPTYIYEIHEIPKKCPDFNSCAVLFDNISSQGLERTKARESYDMEQLEKDDCPRNLYFLAQMKLRKYYREEIGVEEVIRAFRKRLEHKVFPEEEYLCLKFLAMIYLKIENNYKVLQTVFEAAKIFPSRCGECYFEIYNLTGKKHFLKMAYENRYFKNCVFPIDVNLTEMIEKEYLIVQRTPAYH